MNCTTSGQILFFPYKYIPSKDQDEIFYKLQAEMRNFYLSVENDCLKDKYSEVLRKSSMHYHLRDQLVLIESERLA